MRNATPKQLKAFQAADELELQFGAVVAAWRASLKAAARRPGAFDIREVEQVHHFWTAPEHVANDRLNGTRRNKRGYPVRVEPTVLACASEPAEAGFRLASLGELAGVSKAEHRARVEEARWKPSGRRQARSL